MSTENWILVDGTRSYDVPASEVPSIQRRIDAARAGGSGGVVDFVPAGSAERVRLRVRVSGTTHLRSPAGEVI